MRASTSMNEEKETVMEYKRTIIVTGGAGFIGSHVVRLMVNKYPQYRIINLDKLTYAGNLANLKDVEDKPNYMFVKADICDFDLMLSLMKDEAVLIKTARGGVVDENALADALKNGKIRAACIDTITKEPMSEDCVLFGIENCYITPHIAWAAKQTRQRLVV